MKNTLILLSISVILLSGCASIIHGTYQKIEITSQPKGATIIVDGKKYGTTPQLLKLKRMGRFKEEPKEKQSYAVTLEMEGFHPFELTIRRQVDGWFIGNVFIGGLLGIIIDATNGSMYKLTPGQINANLGQVTSSEDKLSGNLYVAVTLTPDPTWEKIGQLDRR